MASLGLGADIPDVGRSPSILPPCQCLPVPSFPTPKAIRPSRVMPVSPATCRYCCTRLSLRSRRALEVAIWTAPSAVGGTPGRSWTRVLRTGWCWRWTPTRRRSSVGAHSRPSPESAVGCVWRTRTLPSWVTLRPGRRCCRSMGCCWTSGSPPSNSTRLSAVLRFAWRDRWTCGSTALAVPPQQIW